VLGDLCGELDPFARTFGEMKSEFRNVFATEDRAALE
jgi:hypothetical protein